MAQVVALQMCADAFQSHLLTKKKKVVGLKKNVAKQLGKWEIDNEILMVATQEAQFLDKDQKATFDTREVHERALSSRVEIFFMGNEIIVKENEKLQFEISELKVNPKRFGLELLRFGPENVK